MLSPHIFRIVLLYLFLDKTPEENAFLIKVTNHFQSHAKQLGAIEIEGNIAM